MGLLVCFGGLSLAGGGYHTFHIALDLLQRWMYVFYREDSWLSLSHE